MNQTLESPAIQSDSQENDIMRSDGQALTNAIAEAIGEKGKYVGDDPSHGLDDLPSAVVYQSPDDKRSLTAIQHKDGGSRLRISRTNKHAQTRKTIIDVAENGLVRRIVGGKEKHYSPDKLSRLARLGKKIVETTEWQK
jgi:hypothetical protein